MSETSTKKLYSQNTLQNGKITNDLETTLSLIDKNIKCWLDSLILEYTEYTDI